MLGSETPGYLDFHVLDLGAGAGIVEQMDFRGHARRIRGIDTNPGVVENPTLTKVRLGSANPSPTRMPALTWSSSTTSSSICLTRPGCLRRSRGCCARAGGDVFPTRYRANSPADIRRLAAVAGLEVVKIDLSEGRPEYLRFSAPTYLLGWLYERLVNQVPGLWRLRVLLIAELRKPVQKAP